MGMFDSVMVECPKCMSMIEFQSKAGDCTLTRYYEDDVPNAITCDIAEQVQMCEKCGTEVEAFLLTKPRIMFREKVDG